MIDVKSNSALKNNFLVEKRRRRESGRDKTILNEIVNASRVLWGIYDVLMCNTLI